MEFRLLQTLLIGFAAALSKTATISKISCIGCGSSKSLPLFRCAHEASLAGADSAVEFRSAVYYGRSLYLHIERRGRAALFICTDCTHRQWLYFSARAEIRAF